MRPARLGQLPGGGDGHRGRAGAVADRAIAFHFVDPHAAVAVRHGCRGLRDPPGAVGRVGDVRRPVRTATARAAEVQIQPPPAGVAEDPLRVAGAAGADGIEVVIDPAKAGLVCCTNGTGGACAVPVRTSAAIRLSARNTPPWIVARTNGEGPPTWRPSESCPSGGSPT